MVTGGPLIEAAASLTPGNLITREGCPTRLLRGGATKNSTRQSNRQRGEETRIKCREDQQQEHKTVKFGSPAKQPESKYQRRVAAGLGTKTETRLGQTGSWTWQPEPR